MSWLLWFGLDFFWGEGEEGVISATYFLFCRSSFLPGFVPHQTVRWGMNTFGREIRPLILQDVCSDTSRSQFDRKDWLEKETI